MIKYGIRKDQFVDAYTLVFVISWVC